MKRLKIFAILTAALLPSLCAGQHVSITSAPFPPDQSIRNIVGMTQDASGFIWIADSNNGLFRYDGIRLRWFRPEAGNVNSIIASRLECVYADREDNIWIGSFQNGLEHFNPETGIFTHYQHDSSDPGSIGSDSVRAILETRDGTLWIGTAQGLDRFDRETGTFTHIEDTSEDARLISRDHVRVLYEDKAGNLWIGCGSPFSNDDPESASGGLYRMDKVMGKITRYQHDQNDENSLIDNRVRAIFEDSRGVFWVGTSGDGLHIMDRKSGTFQRCTYDPLNPQKLSRPALRYSYNYADDHITFINEDARGCIWIGTFSGGLNRYNPATLTMEHFGVDEEEPYKIGKNDFWSCIRTRDDLLWVSGWQPSDNDQALYKISTTSNILNHTDLEDRARAFTQGDDGVLWIGTSQGLLRKRKDDSFDRFLVDKNNGGAANVILHLEHDKNNNLWVSTPRGLHYFNTNTKVFTSYRYDENSDNSLSSDTVIVTKLNDDGSIWIGTYLGLDLLDLKTGTFKYFKNDPSDPTTICDNEIHAIAIDRAGNTWIGTNLGLSRFDKNSGKFKTMLENRTFIYCVFKDSRDRLWAGTFGNGLHVYDPNTNKFSLFRDSTGVLNDNTDVFGITEDQEKSLWLQTAFGYLKVDTETNSVAVFSGSWNINTSFSSMNEAFTSLEGEVLMSDPTGYTHFFPKEIDKQGYAPQPFITKFFLNNNQLIPGADEMLPEPLSKTEKITLNYDQNSFSIEFNNIDFVSSGQEKNLLYKLENYDDVWRMSGGEGKAYYYNIPPGKYAFQIKAVNLYGKWGKKSLSLIITPPWYLTWWAYGLYGLLFIASVYTVHVFQKERVVKAEREKARAKELQQAQEIATAYQELQKTQSQLIQSEKMASLGELTAGIAHEIQNPLNFVNNFAEVSKELMEEMQEELDKGDIEEAKEIARNIDENLNKINHHGSRASSIVKGMLEHSRSGDSQKELVDINILADEYLRLAYHGLRAKDQFFNADFKLDSDESLSRINVVPQEIGRVLLNLINNAFYAVSRKAKDGLENYVPSVTVSTKALKDQVEIRVKDNADGIPATIVDKIFQPFFTTKPTGQGTGLGLSLSYDIITKGHNGSLEVDTTEGIGTEFIIVLPNK